MMCLCCPPALLMFRTPMAQYSLFVLKVLLNTKQLNNKLTLVVIYVTVLIQVFIKGIFSSVGYNVS